MTGGSTPHAQAPPEARPLARPRPCVHRAVRRARRHLLRARGRLDRVDRDPQRLDPQPRLQGRHPARAGVQARQPRRRRDQGAGARRHQVPQVASAKKADTATTAIAAAGLTRQLLVAANGTKSNDRGGVVSSAKLADGRYQVIFDADVRTCALRRRSSSRLPRPPTRPPPSPARSPSRRWRATRTASTSRRPTAPAPTPTAPSTCSSPAETRYVDGGAGRRSSVGTTPRRPRASAAATGRTSCRARRRA